MPLCGTVAVNSNDVCNPPSCAHLRFVYLNGEAFGHAEPGLEDWLRDQEDHADAEGESLDVWEALQTYIQPEGVIVERIDRYMACGPVKIKIWAGFTAKMGPHR